MNLRSFGNESTMKKKIPRDLIKFGVREHEKRKAYLIVTLSLDSQTLTLSAASSQVTNTH